MSNELIARSSPAGRQFAHASQSQCMNNHLWCGGLVVVSSFDPYFVDSNPVVPIMGRTVRKIFVHCALSKCDGKHCKETGMLTYVKCTRGPTVSAL